jgi:hypothetical protein
MKSAANAIESRLASTFFAARKTGSTRELQPDENGVTASRRRG